MPLGISALEAPRSFRLTGELDVSTADELTSRLGHDAAGRGDLSIDLSALSFIDSSGVRALLRLAAGLDGRGRLVLRSPSAAVADVLEIAGLSNPEMGIMVVDDLSDRAETRVFPADRSRLADIRDFVRRRATESSLATWAEGLVLAASEASANAILHSGSPEVRVSWRVLPDRAEVEVRDDGVFHRAIPPERLEQGTRGLLLMMTAVDQLSIVCGTDAHPGTVVRLVKLRNGRPPRSRGSG